LSAPTSTSEKFLPPWWRALLIVASGIWVFAPALQGDWLWDDGLYFTHNPLLQNVAGLETIWFRPGHFIEYYPLSETVQWVQWHLWGMRTPGYHVTNLALHLLNALLVWRLLTKFGLRLAWLGGLLFAIHPVQVESVAWIAELKNTLSLAPFLLAMMAWIDFEQRGKRCDYLLALGLFLVAMLCKISMALFPAVMLLYAWWKNGKIRWGDLKLAAPFLIISVVLVTVTWWAGNEYRLLSQLPADTVPLGGALSRIALAGLTFSFYLGQCLWPVGLMPNYPLWRIDPPALLQFLPWLVFMGVAYGLWRRRGGWGRHVFLGLGFFALNLAPFLGFIPVSYMSFSWTMDHLLYLPIIGLVGLVVAGVEQSGTILAPAMKRVGAGLVVLVFVLLACESHRYAGLYINGETLWTYAIRENPSAWLPRYALSAVEMREGRIPEAIAQLEQVVRLNPGKREALYNLATSRMATGDHAGALADLVQYCQQFTPDRTTDYAEVWICLQRAREGQSARAATELSSALKRNWYSRPSDGITLVAQYLLGGINEPSLLAAAAANNPEQDRARHCEAWYYIGMKRLLSGDRPAAAEAFQHCIATGESEFAEYLFAQAELRAIPAAGQ